MHNPLPKLLALAIIAGCQTPEGGGAYVLADHEARVAGVAVEVNGMDLTAPTPVRVHPDDDVRIYIDDLVIETFVGPGELLQIKGTEVVSGLLGEDVAAGVMTVNGSEDAAEELVWLTGATLRDDLVFAEHLYELMADLDAPEGLIEVAPLSPDESPVGSGAHAQIEPLPALTGHGKPHTVSVSHVMTGFFADDAQPKPITGEASPGLGTSGELHRDPLHVGVYASPDSCLILDASGNAGPCAGPRHMRWSSDEAGVWLHTITTAEHLALDDGALRRGAQNLNRVELR